MKKRLNWKEVAELIELDRDLNRFNNLYFDPYKNENEKISPTVYPELYKLLGRLKESPYSKIYSETIISLEKITGQLEQILKQSDISTTLQIPFSPEAESADDIPF